MRALQAAAVFVILLASMPHAAAFSPIWTVDRWDPNQLQKAGITVEPWSHELVGEDPPLNWIKVTYDCTKLPGDHYIVATLWLTAANGDTMSTYRAERAEGGAKELSLLFAVRDVKGDSSRLEILVPELLSNQDAGQQSGFAGYSLRLKRLLELARNAPAQQASAGDQK